MPEDKKINKEEKRKLIKLKDFDSIDYYLNIFILIIFLTFDVLS